MYMKVHRTTSFTKTANLVGYDESERLVVEPYLPPWKELTAEEKELYLRCLEESFEMWMETHPTKEEAFEIVAASLSDFKMTLDSDKEHAKLMEEYQRKLKEQT